jgi:Carboxypeptidase regulatory-like domain
MLRIAARALALCLLFHAALRVRAQDFHGALLGEVRDSAGAAIAGAAVDAVSADTRIDLRKQSDAHGAFRFDNLPPGRYQLHVAAPGFANARSEVEVVVGASRQITATLLPAHVSETVSVQATVSSITEQPLDRTNAVQQAVIGRRDLETLPLAARSFANIAYLAPGTEPVEPSDPTKARITAVSSGGSSGLNIELSVDGGDNSDDYIGGFLQNFSPDAILEFAVRTSQEEADTSRTNGSSVVLTTLRGTDGWHGLGAYYYRGAALNARFPIDNPAPDPKQPFSRQNYVATLGGPILPTRLWFFSSFEGVDENASIAYSPASLQQFQALQQLVAENLVPGLTTLQVPPNVTVPFRDFLGTARLDWAQSAGSQWFLRGAIDSYTTHNAFVQQAALPSTGATSHNEYLNLVLNNQLSLGPLWSVTSVLAAGGLHLTESRNANLGFALAFPFTTTSSTISGLETLGDNQFITPITAFPVLRNQEKYQARVDLRRTTGRHALTFGINLIHEPVLGGALSGTQETLVSFPQDPLYYQAHPSQLATDYAAGSVTTPAANGSFSQNVQRLGLYAEDSAHVNSRLTVNFGLRWDTTYGLFLASGRRQSENPGLETLQALAIPLVRGIPHDDRQQFAPRLGVAYAPFASESTVFRAGIGLFFNDLAQNGWVSAFQAVNAPPLGCPVVGASGCVPSAASVGPVGNIAGSAAVIDPGYKTPYALHVTAGVQHAFSARWTSSIDYTHQEGNHAFRRYQYQAGYTLTSPLYAADVDDQRSNIPNVTLFRTDNRSSYNALALRLQGNLSRVFSLEANYRLSRAATWGCVLGELFDYVNGVCNPLRAFGPGDYGPSGEDVRHRLVIAGIFHAPGGTEISTLSQLESARPFTLTTTVPVTGVGDGFDNRAVVNGHSVALDGLRGTPYAQVDLRVSRPVVFHDRWQLTPFAEFFNLFNRNNPGANYVTDIAALPVPAAEVQNGNVTDLCVSADCTSLRPITSLKQLRVPSGALGDFFGPGTTVGAPFAAQLGLRLTF